MVIYNRSSGHFLLLFISSLLQEVALSSLGLVFGRVVSQLDACLFLFCFVLFCYCYISFTYSLFVCFCLSSQDKSDSDTEKVKSTVMLSYGYTVLYAPPG